MEKFKYIFVILVYRNTQDLEECIQSIENFVLSYKIIVVNAFYDEESKEKVKTIAENRDCAFINIENKGYSYGNNIGIEYARNKFDYEYLIVSNPDITISKFDDFIMNQNFAYDIIAPKITAADGRLQNPMYVKKPHISEWLEYKGFKYRLLWLVRTGIFISKLNRAYNVRINSNKNIYAIYGAHGCFVMLSKKAVDKLYPVYDENMFLFAEEMVLAIKSSNMGLKTCYYDGISIKHKEDGSMKLSNLKMYEELRKSNLYYYEHYII